MSTCAALVYIQKDGLCFGFCYLSFFSSYEFGLSSEARPRRRLTYERKKPHIVLIV